MDVRDYVELLRRGALTIVVTTVLAAIASVAYLQVTPKTYQSTASVLVAPRVAATLSQLQVGAQYATASAPTIASLMGTSAVMVPAARSLVDDGAAAGITPAELAGSVGVAREESSSVLRVTAVASAPDRAAALANAVAQAATERVPRLVNDRTPSGRRSLVDLQVVQEASAPTAPTAPAPRRVTVLFLAVGLALGLAITLLRQSLDNRLRKAADIVETTQVPLLATLIKERRSAHASIIVRDAPASPGVEGYRVLRTNLGALAPGPRCSVVVAAANSDATAVRVPVNLACSMAQAGRRVLLIDLDLRHSAIADMFGIDSRRGAAEVLTGRAELGDGTVATSLPGLDVLPNGTANQAPSDLLSGQTLETMLRQAEDAYDYVLIHAPPLLSFTDAAVVARAASCSVMVVRAGHTRVQDLTSTVGVLGNVGVTPLGIVLTDAATSVTEDVSFRDDRDRGTSGGHAAQGRAAATSRAGVAAAPGGRSSGAEA